MASQEVDELFLKAQKEYCHDSQVDSAFGRDPCDVRGLTLIHVSRAETHKAADRNHSLRECYNGDRSRGDDSGHHQVEDEKDD